MTPTSIVGLPGERTGMPPATAGGANLTSGLHTAMVVAGGALFAVTVLTAATLRRA